MEILLNKDFYEQEDEKLECRLEQHLPCLHPQRRLNPPSLINTI